MDRRPTWTVRGAALRVWNVLYAFGYGCLRGAVVLLFRPLFGVRRAGPMPRLPRGGYLVCANHASWLDPAFVQLVIPRRINFVMTSSWYDRPLGRWFFRLVAAVPIDSGRNSHAGLRRAIELLRAGRVVALFPEGRLSRDGSLGPAQRGIAIVARMAGAPVLPLGIAGNFEVWPRGARYPRRGDVRIAFGRPFRWSAVGEDHDRDDEQRFAEGILAAVAQARTRAESAGRVQRRTRP